MVTLSEESLLTLASWLVDADPVEESRVEHARQLADDYEVYPTAHILTSATTAAEYKVALQFPDTLLPHAPFVCAALHLVTSKTQEETGDSTAFLYFILGDTSYGECCVDEVAAQHLSADIVVHYGNACLSPTRFLPVLYVIPKFHFEQPHVTCTIFKRSVGQVLRRDDVDRLVLLFDAELSSCFQEQLFVANGLHVAISWTEAHKKVSVASLRVGKVTKIVSPEECIRCDDSFIQVGALKYPTDNVPLQRTAFLWFTRQANLEEWPAAVRDAALQLCTGPQEHCAAFFGASLTTATENGPILVDAWRILRKRFAVLAKTKDAERIGIVPGTLGVSGNLEVIERCKQVIKSTKKRSYMMLVGKPNPAKLANFAEIDVFVLVACPQNTLLDGREYLRPIITPLELEAALLRDGDIFSTSYSLDFRELLQKSLKLEDDVDAENEEASQGSALVTRGNWSVSVTGNGAAADFLQSRHWQGLSYSHGGACDETDVAELSTRAVPGQVGIACKYDKEVERGT